MFSFGTKIASQCLSHQILFITLYYLNLRDKEVLWFGCEMSHTGAWVPAFGPQMVVLIVEIVEV